MGLRDRTPRNVSREMSRQIPYTAALRWYPPGVPVHVLAWAAGPSTSDPVLEAARLIREARSQNGSTSLAADPMFRPASDHLSNQEIMIFKNGNLAKPRQPGEKMRIFKN